MTVPSYRLLDAGAARIAVASPLQTLHAHLDMVYPHLEPQDAAGFADVRVSLLPEALWRPGRRQVRMWCDSQSPFETYPVASALPLFEWGSNWLLSQRLNAYLLLHAGVVAREDRAVLLPAMPGSGKTTLTCALHLAGWRFLSDEFGVLDPDTGEILPMTRPAPLKNESIQVIRARPGAVLGPLFPKTRKGDVAHFVPDRDSFSQRHRRARPALVVFPRFQAGAALTCNRVDAAQAAMRLGLNSFNYQALGPVGLHAVATLARQTHAYELQYGDLDEAISQVEQLLESAP